jgi:hypothetical protein
MSGIAAPGGYGGGHLAPDDARDVLVRQAHDRRDVLEREAVSIGSTERLVALASQLLALALEGGVSACVVPSEGL